MRPCETEYIRWKEKIPPEETLSWLRSGKVTIKHRSVEIVYMITVYCLYNYIIILLRLYLLLLVTVIFLIEYYLF